MTTNILVGFDGRPRSLDALTLAEGLARLTDSTLLLARVESWGPYDADAPETLQNIRRQAEERLAAAASAVRERGIAVETAEVQFGSPARCLHRLAELHRPRLVVVGSTHRGNLGRVLAGNIACKLLHGSSCPVAVATAGLADAGDWKPKTIGLAYDASPEAHAALEQARSLARASGAGIRLIAVAEQLSTPHEVLDAEAVEVASRERAQNWLHEARGLLRTDVDTDSELRFGEPAAELEAVSETLDLLVTGSRAYGPVRRVLLGSVASHVVAHSRCPVLVTPRGSAAVIPDGSAAAAAVDGGLVAQ